MPTINLEMMKQLLQEFSEKEALTTEEINVIEQEVSNLEKRIEHCHTKLQYLSEDKEKLAAIRERYTSGSSSSPARIGIKETAKERIPKSIPATKPAAIVESVSRSADITEAPPEKETVSTIKEEVKTPKESEPEPTSTKTKTQKAVIEEFKEDSQEDKADQDASSKESGDTIKSINDALKGLFRK